MKLTDYQDKHGTLSVLITGLSGSGKSTLAATLSKKYRLIWIDVENAMELLYKLPMEQKENIEVIKLPDSAAFPIAAQTTQRLFKELKARICLEHGVINCTACVKNPNNAIWQEVDLGNLDKKKDVVVLDSLTQVGASFLAHIMKENPYAKPMLDDWGALRKNTEYLASNIQRLPFNFVATSLCTVVQMDDKTEKLVPTFGSRDMSANIAAKFSTVIFCQVKNKKHEAFSSSTASNLFLSKSRLDYRIEDGELDLCPMFDTYLSTSSTAEQAPEAPKESIEPKVTSLESIHPNTVAKNMLLNLKNS